MLIAVLLAAFGGYRVYAARRDAAASALLSSAKTPADFQKVIADYPGSPAAPSASLLLADAQRKEKQFADANTTLQAFVARNPKHELITTAKLGIAANLESLGKNDEALEMYRRVAAEHPRDFNAPSALLSQVHLFKQKGQIEEARRVCETVMTQYRESYASQEASQILRTLKTPLSAEVPKAPRPNAGQGGATPAAPKPAP